jgi:Arc/MetJ-type ribon-helix-helix transcriptional regulator
MRFMRKTVTIPSDLKHFVEERVAHPKHAGNLSSYVRNLILEDRAQHPEVIA